MIGFIQTYWKSILIISIGIVSLLYLYKYGNKKRVKQIILALVVEAEKLLGSKTGELKYAMVVKQIYVLLPNVLRLMLTKKELDDMIEESVDYLKSYLKEEKNLLGYEEEYRKVEYDNAHL